MFEDLVRRLFPDLGAEIKKALISELRAVGKELLSTHVTRSVSRLVVKGLDGVIGAAVKHLSEENAAILTQAYLAELDDQMTQFSTALRSYTPHVVAVARAKKDGNATRLKAAREQRDLFLAEVREEVRDLLLAATGETPED